MGKALHVEDIDSIEFQRKEWAFQRVGWALLGAFVAAALLGFFSVGPLSETVAGDREAGLEVRYQKFTRHDGTTEIKVSLGERAVKGSTATLFLNDDFVDAIRVESIEPQPDTVTSTELGSTYEFSAEAGSPPTVEIRYRPDQIGPVDAVFRAGNGTVSFWQLTYP